MDSDVKAIIGPASVLGLGTRSEGGCHLPQDRIVIELSRFEDRPVLFLGPPSAETAVM